MSITIRLALAVVLTIALGSTARAADGPTNPIDYASERVVKIFGAGGIKNLYAYSSGFLVSPQGHIVTAWSHVLDEQSVSVVLHDGRKFQGVVKGADSPLDLAVIKIEAEDLPFFELQDAVAVTTGSRVLAFSNMFKVATGDEPVSVMHGVIAAQTKLQARRGTFESPYTGPVYVVDAITNNPGSAGGVLTTRDGALVGMIGKELRNSSTNTWINYAVPISVLRPTIEDIVAGRTTRKTNDEDPAEPGAKVARYVALDFGIVLVPDVVPRTPAFVDAVIAGSPAAKADIRPNDLILFVGESLVQSCRGLREALADLEAGDKLKLVIRRDNILVPIELPVEKKEVTQ